MHREGAMADGAKGQKGTKGQGKVKRGKKRKE
jgi:hypothetical protein